MMRREFISVMSDATTRFIKAIAGSVAGWPLALSPQPAGATPRVSSANLIPTNISIPIFGRIL